MADLTQAEPQKIDPTLVKKLWPRPITRLVYKILFEHSFFVLLRGIAKLLKGSAFFRKKMHIINIIMIIWESNLGE